MSQLQSFITHGNFSFSFFLPFLHYMGMIDEDSPHSDAPTGVDTITPIVTDGQRGELDSREVDTANTSYKLSNSLSNNPLET